MGLLPMLFVIRVGLEGILRVLRPKFQAVSIKATKMKRVKADLLYQSPLVPAPHHLTSTASPHILFGLY